MSTNDTQGTIPEKTYHIVWKANENDAVSIGQNFDGINELYAHTRWRERHPHAIFKSMNEVDMSTQKREKRDYEEHTRPIIESCPLRHQDIMGKVLGQHTAPMT